MCVNLKNNNKRERQPSRGNSMCKALEAKVGWEAVGENLLETRL